MTPKTQIIMREGTDALKVMDELKRLDLSKPHVVNIEPLEDKHTDKQRKTYWMWLDEIVAQGGGTGNRYGQDEHFRKTYLTPTTYTMISGKESSFLKSVSQLNKKELSHLMSEVWVIAHEFGMTLKDPEGYRYGE